MKPARGARFTLRLAETSPLVVYRFEVETPNGVRSGQASVELEAGEVRTQSDGELPAWLSGTMTRLLRSLWRARTAPGSPPWPRRLTRWRDSADEGS